MEASAVSNVCQRPDVCTLVLALADTDEAARRRLAPERSGAAGGRQRLRRGLGLLRRHAGGAAHRATVSSRERVMQIGACILHVMEVFTATCVTRPPLAAEPSHFQTFDQRVGRLAVSNVGTFAQAQAWSRHLVSACAPRAPSLTRSRQRIGLDLTNPCRIVPNPFVTVPPGMARVFLT